MTPYELNEQLLTAVRYTKPKTPAQQELIVKQCEHWVREGANVNAKDSHGRTALLHATFANNVIVCDALLSMGADPFAKGYARRTVLHDATRFEESYLVEKYMDLGVSHDVFDVEGNAPIHCAVLNGNALITALFCTRGVDPDLLELSLDPDHPGMPPLYRALMREDYATALTLLSHGADPRKVFKSDALSPDALRILFFPLHHVARLGSVGACLSLLNLGLDPEQLNGARLTPAEAAAKVGAHKAAAAINAWRSQKLAKEALITLGGHNNVTP